MKKNRMRKRGRKKMKKNRIRKRKEEEEISDKVQGI